MYDMTLEWVNLKWWRLALYNLIIKTDNPAWVWTSYCFLENLFHSLKWLVIWFHLKSMKPQLHFCNLFVLNPEKDQTVYSLLTLQKRILEEKNIRKVVCAPFLQGFEIPAFFSARNTTIGHVQIVLIFSSL